MKKQLLTALCFVAGSLGLSAQNSVTFYVNMSNETVPSEGVHVAGSFQSEIGASADWLPDQTALTDMGGGIYSFTATGLPNGIYEFRYLNGNAWGTAETVPVECRVGDGNENRFFVINGADVYLPPVYFGAANASDGSVSLQMIRFIVDLTGSTIAPEGVHVAGNWQVSAGGAADWQPGQDKLTDVTPNDNLDNFTGIFYVPESFTAFQYKFINGNNFSGAETIPSACNVGDNRSATISGPTVLKYCFSSCSDVCIEIPDYTLTLNVDMNYNCNFNVNSNDSVDFAGPYNGWAGGTYLTDADNDGVYSVTIIAPAGEFVYKARIIKNLSPSWEVGVNKIVQLDADNTIAPTRCFGVDAPGSCAPIPNPATITFRVDMTNETPASTIYVKGSFTTPTWDDGEIALVATPGNPGVFEAVVEDVCPAVIRYKFVNGPDMVLNEEQYPSIGTDTLCLARNPFNNWERSFVRTDANDQTLQFVYNRCTELSIGIEDVKPLVVNMFPNPADNSTMIRFNNSTANHTLLVTDILGNQISRVNNVRGSYLIERGNLSSGIYFVQVTDAKGQSSTQKLIFR
jgi:hypothetical protein